MLVHDHSSEAMGLYQLHLGGDRNWQYLLVDPSSGRTAAVDCGHAPDQLHAFARERGLAITLVLVTHGHGDHTGGVPRLAELTGAPVRAGRDGLVPGARRVSDGEAMPLGALEVEAMITPGHAPDHVCFRCGPALFTGDLLFCGKVGGTGSYFPGSSAAEQWVSLKRILALPDEVLVLPGHDYYGGEGEMPVSTVGHERRHNPFLLCEDLASFEQLKARWAAYKKEHGIR
jgi:glyoxylase-like metal-dependent hydrolase (beta-lactamase superfamily II)